MTRHAADLFAAPTEFLGFQSSYADFATGVDPADLLLMLEPVAMLPSRLFASVRSPNN
jgi:hypothetical protein